MGEGNQSTTSDFLLMGLFGHTGPRLVLFLLVTTTFTMGLLANTVLLVLTWVDPRLHTPMYFLLGHLSLLDLSFPLVTVPKMLADFLQGDSTISFTGCMAQMFLLMLLGVSEGVLLALMSYDCYVAVCHPLHYPILMWHQVCLLMVAVSWLSGALVVSVQMSVILRFPFCASRALAHFVCELPALLRLACAPSVAAYELALSVSGVLILLLPLSLIATSYGLVLGAVLRKDAAQAWRKALATCSSHATVVGLFYGAAVFMYMVPVPYHHPHQDHAVALCYSLLTPTLNPLIYSLRSREVRAALALATGRAGSGSRR
ncbi:olfactory receptor 2Z1-like [Erethizon dorsatum]